jgi:hypothetical protein
MNRGVRPLFVMNTKQKARWSKLRAKGKRRFLLVEGLLKIGGTYAALSLVANYLFKYGFRSPELVNYLLRGETIFKFIFDWLFFGLIMGLFFWYLGEREFKKMGKDEKQVGDSKSGEA